MSKNALVFAVYVPVIGRLQGYLDHIKQYYSDCDVYVGLNPSAPESEMLLRQNGFYNIEHVDKNLVVNSDASAYQATLKLLKNSNKSYDTIYFLHTKGISYQNDKQWLQSYQDYFVGFCVRRKLVDENIIKDGIGGVGYVGRKEPMDNSGYSKALDMFCPKLPQRKVDDMMSLITFYGIRGNIIKLFLDNCNIDFFTTKLDRYFFEAYFPLVVDKCGYKRHHIHIWD